MTAPDVVLSIITQQLNRWKEYLDDVGVPEVVHNLNFLLCVAYLALGPAGNLFERIVDVRLLVDDLEDLSKFATGYKLQYPVFSVKFVEG